jgi:hypothetical protein
LAVKGAEADIDGGSFTDYSASTDIEGGDFLNYKNLINYDGGYFKYSDGEVAILNSLASCSMDTDNVKITGVQIVPTDTEATTYLCGSDGYVISIKDNPLSQDGIDQLVVNIGAKLNGFEFRPLNVSAKGDPRYESGDVAAVTYRGVKYPAIISNLSYTIRGNESFSSDAESEAERASTRYSASAKAEQSAKTATEQKFTAYDVAVRNLNSLMANALGFYMSSVKQADGSTIEYMSDKPNLLESKIIWKRTLDGFAISTDGGKTWGAGFTSDGNAVVKILTALGINAEWINAGTLDASKITVTNLNAGSITTGVFNANLIKTGKIQSVDGTAYFDLDTGDLAAKKLVSDDGSVFVKVLEDGAGYKYVDMYGSTKIHGDLDLGAYGVDCGTISATNMHSTNKTICTGGSITTTKNYTTGAITDVQLHLNTEMLYYYSSL